LAIRVFNEIEYVALWNHPRMIKDNTNLFKTAQSNNEEKLPLNALCDTSYILYIPSQYLYPIKFKSKQILTNFSGWCQNTGLEGTVTDELFQVFHIERPVLLEVPDVGRPVDSVVEP
jgi:hypothetical protein